MRTPVRLETRNTQQEQQRQQQAPDGWSLHEDPTTGHAYYLHDATHESVWAEADGSFPRVNNGAAAEHGGGEEDDGGGDDTCAEWDAGIFLGAGGAGGRPAPTAPPPLSYAMELAEHGAEIHSEGKKTRFCLALDLTFSLTFPYKEVRSCHMPVYSSWIVRPY